MNKLLMTREYIAEIEGAIGAPLVLSVIVLFLVIFYLQVKLAAKQQKLLSTTGGCNLSLVSPGEEITYYGSVNNLSPYPVMYVNNFEVIPKEFELLEDDKWKKKHLLQNAMGYTTKFRMYMLPYTKFEKEIHFKINKRGSYQMGKQYLETGDFLGLKSELLVTESQSQIVVIPEICSDQELLLSFGGFLGDISVRRFILEDPIMNLGYRDYTGREPMRDISWVQTARAGKLQVKEHDHTVEVKLAVLVNMEAGNEEDKEKCLSIARMVCEELEVRHFPYAFYSTGDLVEMPEGLGKYHLDSIMRGLGKSKLINLYHLENLVDDMAKNRFGARGYIVISPPLEAKAEATVRRLETMSGHPLCILIGKGEAHDE